MASRTAIQDRADAGSIRAFDGRLTPDLTVTHDLSVGLIERLTCPTGALKAFLRDKDVTGLRVRVTSNGAGSFVFEATAQRGNLRVIA